MTDPMCAETDEVEAFRRLEREGWARAAGHYEESWSGLTRLFVEPLLEAAGVGLGQRLLDVACGPGYLAEEAARRGAEPVGVDFEPAMVRQAAARCPALPFVEGDAERLEFPAASFDRVLIGFGLLHFPRPERALAEARRVLRPGGRLAFTLWAGRDQSPGARAVDDAVGGHAAMPPDLPAGPALGDLADGERCGALLAGLGFDPETLRFTTVVERWRVPSADFLFEAERRGGVRTAALLARQSPERLAAIRAALDSTLRPFAADGGYLLPMAAHLVAITMRA